MKILSTQNSLRRSQQKAAEGGFFAGSDSIFMAFDVFPSQTP
jgi:hypothetical protein